MVFRGAENLAPIRAENAVLHTLCVSTEDFDLFTSGYIPHSQRAIEVGAYHESAVGAERTTVY